MKRTAVALLILALLTGCAQAPASSGPQQLPAQSQSSQESSSHSGSSQSSLPLDSSGQSPAQPAAALPSSPAYPVPQPCLDAVSQALEELSSGKVTGFDPPPAPYSYPTPDQLIQLRREEGEKGTDLIAYLLLDEQGPLLMELWLTAPDGETFAPSYVQYPGYEVSVKSVPLYLSDERYEADLEWAVGQAAEIAEGYRAGKTGPLYPPLPAGAALPQEMPRTYQQFIDLPRGSIYTTYQSGGLMDAKLLVDGEKGVSMQLLFTLNQENCWQLDQVRYETDKAARSDAALTQEDQTAIAQAVQAQLEQYRAGQRELPQGVEQVPDFGEDCTAIQLPDSSQGERKGALVLPLEPEGFWVFTLTKTKEGWSCTGQEVTELYPKFYPG